MICPNCGIYARFISAHYEALGHNEEWLVCSNCQAPTDEHELERAQKWRIVCRKPQQTDDDNFITF